MLYKPVLGRAALEADSEMKTGYGELTGEYPGSTSVGLRQNWAERGCHSGHRTLACSWGAHLELTYMGLSAPISRSLFVGSFWLKDYSWVQLSWDPWATNTPSTWGMRSKAQAWSDTTAPRTKRHLPQVPSCVSPSLYESVYSWCFLTSGWIRRWPNGASWMLFFYQHPAGRSWYIVNVLTALFCYPTISWGCLPSAGTTSAASEKACGGGPCGQLASWVCSR